MRANAETIEKAQGKLVLGQDQRHIAKHDNATKARVCGLSDRPSEEGVPW